MEKENERSPQDNLDIRVKLLYAISSFGSYTVFVVFLTSVIIYYREILLLPSIFILYAFSIYAILNALNGVFFGWISDRTKTKKGRRIPYLKYLAPFLALSFVMVWVSPSKEEIGVFGVFLWMLISMILFDIFYNTTNLAYMSLGQELSMDNQERANIQAINMYFGIISTLISLIIPIYILENLSRNDFIYFTIILALLQLITMLITAFTIKERLEFSQVQEALGFKQSFKQTIKNKSFLIVGFTNFWIIFLQALLFGNMFFFIFYVYAQYNSSTILILIAIFILSGLFVGTYYTLKINAKKGLKPALTWALIITGVGLILIGIIPGIFALCGFFLFGFGLFGIVGLINTAYGAVADEDEVKNGTRREAAIFGIDALITKPAQSIAGIFIAFILILFRYQEPIGGVQQSQSNLTLLGFKLAMGLIPGIIMLICALVFRMYPLHGDYLEKIQSKMYQMHEEKSEKYEALKMENNS
jgi:GPH family glycoside/pentoside/hexuronide:cation symporter